MENKVPMLQKSCLKCNGLGYIEKLSNLSTYTDLCLECNGSGLIQVVDEKILKEIEANKEIEMGHCSLCGKKEEKYKLVTLFGSKELVCFECTSQGNKKNL